MNARSLLRCLFLAAVLADVLGAAPAAAVEVTIQPEAPTYFDSVQVVAEATLEASCALRLTPPNVVRLGGDQPTRIFLRLQMLCPPGGTPGGGPPELVRVRATADLGRLEAGAYVVRFIDPIGMPDLPFTVYIPGSERLELPAAATDEEPGALRLDYLYTCYFCGAPPAPSIRVDGRVIVVEATIHQEPLPITLPPPRTQVVAANLPLPPLAAGDYEVRVVGVGPDGFRTLVRGDLRVWRAAGCVPSAHALCLQNGRFRVAGSWQTFDGSTGTAKGRPLAGNEGSALLWFFAPSNVELSIKVMDGCGVNGRWWVFLASGSNVEYTVDVTDTLTGVTRTYSNPLGTLPPLVADTAAFPCGG